MNPPSGVELLAVPPESTIHPAQAMIDVDFSNPKFVFINISKFLLISEDILTLFAVHEPYNCAPGTITTVDSVHPTNSVACFNICRFNVNIDSAHYFNNFC